LNKPTWKPGAHHPVEQKSDFAKNNPKLYEATYKNFTIPLSGEEHVQTHRDIKEVGRAGSVARIDKARLQG
jgi:hypothetical protein